MFLSVYGSNHIALNSVLHLEKTVLKFTGQGR